jgi:ATP phosphoribosyltransferase regulatory subunit
MGISGLRADLEVITTAVEAIENCTSADFKIEIGHAGFFKELCKKLNVTDETVSEIYECVESRNFVSLNNILDKIGKNDITDCIRNLPRFFGGVEIIEKAKQIDLGDEGQKSLDYLKELYEFLCKAGLENKIVIDLSLVNRTNYYTGIIFKGYLQGSGVSVVSGGRYDCLGAEFGREMPSTDFGIETGALATVMLSRNEVDEEKTPEVIVFSEKELIVKALAYSKNLRYYGTYCENSTFETLSETKEYAKSKGINKICIVTEDGVREEIV